MDKKIVMLGTIIGSIIGGYLPTIFGVSAFSVSSVICGGFGGAIGLWLSFKLLN